VSPAGICWTSKKWRPEWLFYPNGFDEVSNMLGTPAFPPSSKFLRDRQGGSTSVGPTTSFGAGRTAATLSITPRCRG
jgi:hypothetical protein